MRDHFGGAAETGDLIDDGAADDDGFGVLRDEGGLFRRGDSEADGNRERGVSADFRGHLADGVGDLGLHSRDAFARDVVDETRGPLDDERDAVVGRGGRDEVDDGQPGVAHEGFVVVGFLGREVEDEQAIDARGGGIADELRDAAAVEEVVVNVEHEGNLRVAADGADGVENLGGRGAGLEAALGGELVHEAVGERIAEGHADFEDVHARAIKGEGELARGLKVWVTTADVNDETFPALRPQPDKTIINAIHDARPCQPTAGVSRARAARFAGFPISDGQNWTATAIEPRWRAVLDGRFAGWKPCDTADWEVCGTVRGAFTDLGSLLEFGAHLSFLQCRS